IFLAQARLPAASVLILTLGCRLKNSAEISRNGTERLPAWKITNSFLWDWALFFLQLAMLINKHPKTSKQKYFCLIWLLFSKVFLHIPDPFLTCYRHSFFRA
ncbi:MAG: hypothetical protein ACYSU8_06110, partial [Planctomycetota bacterium]